MKPKKFLFIHQNFPGQFVHVATALARMGHVVVALGITGKGVPGVRYLRYEIDISGARTGFGLAQEFETKLIRGASCARAMDGLKNEGFDPDVIVGHPGWGELLFCKDVWPNAHLLVFAEFFYSPSGADYCFDPEFSRDTLDARASLRMKNTVHLHALAAADSGYAPTHWQHRQLPEPFRGKFRVIFDGVDTTIAKPEEEAFVLLQSKQVRLTTKDEVITFVNRNLEPYRGFHVFMRALPHILEARPNAHCIIVGGDEVSYGSRPRTGKTWRETMLQEVGDRLPAGRVHFVGRLSYANYLRVLQVSSCHVYLTYPFVLSWSCVEAMSAQCVLVAGRTAPVEEVIADGRNGLLVEFFDVQSLTRQVVNVLRDQPAHQHLKVTARRDVVERYDLATLSLPALLELILAAAH